jgi:hypothetical protein
VRKELVDCHVDHEDRHRGGQNEDNGDDGNLSLAEFVHSATTSLRLAVKRRDSSRAAPKLYILPINKLPGVFFRGFIVGHTNSIARSI